MPIVTRTGDDGHSSLFGGERVPKHHPRLEACGTVDEAQSAIGMVRSTGGIPEEIDALLRRLQKELFVVGSDLAAQDPEMKVPRITSTMIEDLEAECESIEKDLARLSAFVLPGGGTAGAMCFYARAVVRRAERSVAAIMAAGQDVSAVLVYLNRLGDLLFLVGRGLNKAAGIAEETWSGKSE